MLIASVEEKYLFAFSCNAENVHTLRTTIKPNNLSKYFNYRPIAVAMPIEVLLHEFQSKLLNSMGE